MPNFTDSRGRWVYPIGPAPEGWERREHCSCTIPHTEAAVGEEWQNDEMNLDHYDDLHFVAQVESYGDGRFMIGVFVSPDDAADAIKRHWDEPDNQWHDKYDYILTAWSGTIRVNVPWVWRKRGGF